MLSTANAFEQELKSQSCLSRSGTAFVKIHALRIKAAAKHVVQAAASRRDPGLVGIISQRICLWRVHRISLRLITPMRVLCHKRTRINSRVGLDQSHGSSDLVPRTGCVARRLLE